jgi:hypothetical protein
LDGFFIFGSTSFFVCEDSRKFLGKIPSATAATELSPAQKRPGRDWGTYLSAFGGLEEGFFLGKKTCQLIESMG